MHDNTSILEGRIERFMTHTLRPARYRRVVELPVTRWDAPGEPVPFETAIAQRYLPAEAGAAWGRPWSTVWLHIQGKVPAELLQSAGADDGLRLEVIVDLGFTELRPGFQCEGLCFDPDGRILKGVNPRNTYVPWRSEDVDLYVEAAANPNVAGDYDWKPTSLGSPRAAGSRELYQLGFVGVGLLDLTVQALCHDMEVLFGLLKQLSADNARRHRLLGALSRAVDVVDPEDVGGTAAAGRAELTQVLATPAAPSAHQVIAVGHAHIDSAWLWPVRETVRKCARTFSNVLSLMDEDPTLVFACSSAQQLAWVRDQYPDLFERIRQRVAEGRFVPVGGMWVEADMNMPAGESLVRQFLLGKAFFQHEFGVDTQEVWVPDTFGYAAGVPQILVQAGNRWFLTQKISWNQVNAMPHHTFLWEGVDGTRLLTHFPAGDTYGAEISAAELAHAQRNFRDHGSSAVSLLPFGWGDGGGGPTRDMLAAAARTKDLEGSPKVRIDTPAAFFEQVEAEGADLPVWSGELYLELHRGVLTTQHWIKQGNRRNEQLLREAELWATAAALRVGAAYPYERLERAWEKVLLGQFHDILPGSSIAWVHEEARRDHEHVTQVATEIIESALAVSVGQGELALAANARPFAEEGLASFAVGPAQEPAPSQIERIDDGYLLRGPRVQAVIDWHGRLISLRGPDEREAIAPDSTGNRLRLYRDLPNQWDAWDIDMHYRRVGADVGEPTEVEVGIDALTMVWHTSRSQIRQTVRVSPEGDAIDLVHELDWQERHTLLSLEVALDLRAEYSSAETQFGYVQRPLHTNTSWDDARFEVCQHRWLHVGEPGYGVAIANDSTYGFHAERMTRADGCTTTTVGLSLLRSPTFPDPESDRGRHELTVRLRPAASVAEAVTEGYRLSTPVRPLVGAHPVTPIVHVDGEGIVVEAIKLAHDRSGDFVVRVYEAHGRRAVGALRPATAVANVIATDLLERAIEPLPGVWFDGEAVHLELRPFQLLTLRLQPA